MTEGSMHGRVALVTGGSRGIGRAAAGCLLEQGASVALAARTAAELNAAAEALAEESVFVRPTDVANDDDVAGLVADVLGRFGRLDALVCSHGVSPPSMPIPSAEPASFRETLAINLVGTFVCATEAVKAMIAQGEGGRIVALSSVLGSRAQPGSCAYNVSKSGVEGLVRTLALDLAEYDITANAVAPGWVDTEMAAPELESLAGLVLNPLDRVGRPEEIGRLIAWLAGPESSYVTGTVITIDGGQTATVPMPWPRAVDYPLK
jgi:NAD(P)-dependent dehydrogenase (short-subunit alcohol dehydrogenase family)